MHIIEQHENVDKGYRIGDEIVSETFLECTRNIFRRAQREFGRCTGKIYVDTKEGPKAIGWHFIKKRQYEDTGRYGRPAEYYIHGVWVQLADSIEESKRTVHPHFL